MSFGQLTTTGERVWARTSEQVDQEADEAGDQPGHATRSGVSRLANLLADGEERAGMH